MCAHLKDETPHLYQGQEDQLEKHVNWTLDQRRRRIRNYRVMFRVALAFCAIGIVSTVLGGMHAMGGGDPRWLMFSILVAVFGASSAWLTLDSTVGIIDLDTKDGIAER